MQLKSESEIPKCDDDHSSKLNCVDHSSILSYDSRYVVLCLGRKNYIYDYKTIERVYMKNINCIIDDNLIYHNMVYIKIYNVKTKVTTQKKIKELIGPQIACYGVRVSLDKFYILCTDVIFELDKNLQICNKYNYISEHGRTLYANNYLIYIEYHETGILIDKINRTITKYATLGHRRCNNTNIFIWDYKNLYVLGRKLKIKHRSKIDDMCHVYNFPAINYRLLKTSNNLIVTNRYIIVENPPISPIKIYNLNLQLIWYTNGSDLKIVGKYGFYVKYGESMKIYEFRIDIKRRILQKIKNTQYWYILRLF